MVATTLGPEAEIADISQSVRSELFRRIIEQHTADPSEEQIEKMMRYSDLVAQMGGTQYDFFKASIHLMLIAAERKLGPDLATEMLADVVAFPTR